MIAACLDAGLREPELVQENEFRTILWRMEQESVQVPAKYRTSTGELAQEFRSTSVEVRNLVLIMEAELNRLEIQELLELKHEGNFRNNYLVPALVDGFLEMKYPQKNHPRQKYRLTAKGKELKKQLAKK